MSKKLITIISSISLLAISTILLLVFFVFNKSPNENTPLFITANDITLTKNESKYNFFSVSKQNATIDFEVDKENIIEINENYVKGLKAGVVCLTIKAQLEDEFTQVQISITVCDNGYSYTITPYDGCQVNENKLTLEKSPCQFKVSVFDELGQIVSNKNSNYSASNEALITYQFNIFMLILQTMTAPLQ